jgi:hypothetical protein
LKEARKKVTALHIRGLEAVSVSENQKQQRFGFSLRTKWALKREYNRNEDIPTVLSLTKWVPAFIIYSAS